MISLAENPSAKGAIDFAVLAARLKSRALSKTAQDPHFSAACGSDAREGDSTLDGRFVALIAI